MSINVMLDTNIILSAIVPNYTWEKSIELFFEDLKQLQKQNNIELKTTGLIKKEINKKMYEVSITLNKISKEIVRSYLNDNKPFNEESIKLLQQKFNYQMVKQKDRKTKLRNRNIIATIESYLTQTIRKNHKESKKVIIQKVLEKIRYLDTELKNSVQQIENDYSIKKLNYPNNSKEQAEIEQLKNKITIRNQKDKKILALFLFYLKKTKTNGIFVTYDFDDFHKNANLLKTQFAELTIFRPDYLSCYCSM